MKYLIIDWMSNVCFNTDNLELSDFDEASEFLDASLAIEYGSGCANGECICREMGHECDDLEDLRGEYSIEEYNEKSDRIMVRCGRDVLIKGYYKN